MEKMRNGGDTAAKEVTETMLVSEEDDNDIEYTSDDIMNLIESSSPTITTGIKGTNFSDERVRFIDDPYTIPMVVQSFTGYITININEESCGSSFSDNDASAMANVDASGLLGCCLGYGGEKGGAWSTNEVKESEYEWDDDLLARFLGEDCV